MPTNNLLLSREDGETVLEPIAEKGSYYEVAFQMLGHSLSDLFLPDNYMLVEGASDQILAHAVYELVNENDVDLRILSCSGISNVTPTFAAMRHTFLPIFEGQSPYSDTTVALIDKLREGDSEHQKIHETLQDLLGSDDDRLYILDKEGLEEYLPEELYKKAGLEKSEQVQKIADATYIEKAAIKKEISSKIAKILESSDLRSIPVIVDAVKSAIAKAARS